MRLTKGGTNMIARRKILVSSLFVLTTFLGMGRSPATGNSIMLENKIPGQVESKALRLTQDLKKQGFEVSSGYFKLWTSDDCTYTTFRMGLCFGNNPAAPYVIMTLPPWPEEFVDPWLGSIFGASRTGYNDIYRLDPREAIVILGQLPPPGAYFSEQTWLFTRQGSFSTDSQRYKDVYEKFGALTNIFFATVPDHPERIQALSSLSNIANNVVIENQSGSAFDQIRYFIITPDRFMDNAVRHAFSGISVKGDDVFTEQIPANMTVGLGQSSDDFTTFIRYAHPDDNTAADTWRKELPMVVLRVRDTRSNRQPLTYPPFNFADLEQRSAVDERPLKDDLDSLLRAVGQRWDQPCAKDDCSDRAGTFTDLQTDPTYMVGPLCIEAKESCLLDNWDTTYQFYSAMSLDNGEIYAVAGTLGTETGNATYVGFGINQVSVLKGAADLSDDDLRDTANAYAGEVNNTDKFYLHYFTRDCSGLEDLTDKHCKSLKEVIPPRDHFAISIRDYIKPDTQRGPDSPLLLPSRVLKLKRP